MEGLVQDCSRKEDVARPRTLPATSRVQQDTRHFRYVYVTCANTLNAAIAQNPDQLLLVHLRACLGSYAQYDASDDAPHRKSSHTATIAHASSRRLVAYAMWLPLYIHLPSDSRQLLASKHRRLFLHTPVFDLQDQHSSASPLAWIGSARRTSAAVKCCCTSPPTAMYRRRISLIHDAVDRQTLPTLVPALWHDYAPIRGRSFD
ncbi:hypothetical protein NUW54_g6711 [Trametes sanguinea]|uniref:Uncharacterized protein n=1 Tax=Trametes sanguinea TaxID=158606 RepID=A0ACC1PRG3_9APHY|nr:hypothetical protein NUW54_g6711 [Trametes sanguinea]